jgi:hypothetical protein
MAMTQQYVFDQSQYNLQFSADGICATLTAVWLKLRTTEWQQGPSHRRDVLDKLARTGGPILQQMATKKWSDRDTIKQNMSGLILLAADAGIQDTKVWDNGSPVQEVINYIKDKPDTGFHFTFGWTESGNTRAHSIGLFRSSFDFVSFDSNSGEYKGIEPDLNMWLTSLLQSYGVSFDWSYLLRLGPRPAPPKQGVKVMGQ